MKENKTAKEKTIILLNEIEEFRQITPSNESIRIPCWELDKKGLDNHFIHTLLKKLSSDEGIIKIIYLGKICHSFTIYGDSHSHPDENNIVLELKEGFDDYCNKIVNNSANNNKSIDNQKKDFELKITYSEHTQEIILNGFFLIANPDFDSENDQVFHYLYKNPNKLIEKGEIMEDLKISLTKDFGKIIENLNFKKDLRKAFFDVSQNSIKLYNPVSKERLEALGIKNIPIQTK